MRKATRGGDGGIGGTGHDGSAAGHAAPQRRSRTSPAVTAGAWWPHALRTYEATAAISLSSRSSYGMP
jgi:hypothetical protein